MIFLFFRAKLIGQPHRVEYRRPLVKKASTLTINSLGFDSYRLIADREPILFTYFFSFISYVILIPDDESCTPVNSHDHA